MFSKIDTMILKKHQEYGEYRQIKDGKTCYWLALWSYTCSFKTLLGMLLIVSLLTFQFEAYLALFANLSIVFVLCTFHMLTYRARKLKYSSKEKIPEIPRFYRVNRVLFLVLSIFPAAVLMRVSATLEPMLMITVFVSMVLLVVHLLSDVFEQYFASCTPLPPGVLDARRQKLQNNIKNTNGLLQPG